MVEPHEKPRNDVGDWTLVGLIKRLNDQRQVIEQILIRLKDLDQNKEEGAQDRMPQKIIELESNVEFALLTNKTIAQNLLRLREEVAQLQMESSQLKLKVNTISQDQSDSILLMRDGYSETICSVLKTLIGSEKSSTEMSQAIQKSREHTARLMKRLCIMGLVKNSSQRVPARFILTELGMEVVRSLPQKVVP